MPVSFSLTVKINFIEVQFAHSETYSFQGHLSRELDKWHTSVTHHTLHVEPLHHPEGSLKPASGRADLLSVAKDYFLKCHVSEIIQHFCCLLFFSSLAPFTQCWRFPPSLPGSESTLSVADHASCADVPRFVCASATWVVSRLGLL